MIKICARVGDWESLLITFFIAAFPIYLGSSSMINTKKKYFDNLLNICLTIFYFKSYFNLFI